MSSQVPHWRSYSSLSRCDAICPVQYPDGCFGAGVANVVGHIGWAVSAQERNSGPAPPRCGSSLTTGECYNAVAEFTTAMGEEICGLFQPFGSGRC